MAMLILSSGQLPRHNKEVAKLSLEPVRVGIENLYWNTRSIRKAKLGFANGKV